VTGLTKDVSIERAVGKTGEEAELAEVVTNARFDGDVVEESVLESPSDEVCPFISRSIARAEGEARTENI
jgi:hypothetical protein